MAGTKNIGQVAGVHIGNTPPENIILIWYDNTPSQMRHKVYDQGLGQWVVLDAYFAKLKGGSVSYGRANMQQTDLYLANDCSFVTCTNTENRNLFLPSSPLDGQMVMVNQVNSANVAVQGNGRKIVDNTDVDYINAGGARRIAIFLYHGSLDSSAGSGAWLFFRWAR